MDNSALDDPRERCIRDYSGVIAVVFDKREPRHTIVHSSVQRLIACTSNLYDRYQIG